MELHFVLYKTVLEIFDGVACIVWVYSLLCHEWAVLLRIGTLAASHGTDPFLS